VDPALIAFGLGVGLLLGMTGIGGGSLMTPLLILVFGIKPVTAVGTDLAYAAVTKTVGGYKHLRQRTVDLGVSTWMAFGSVPAAIGGVYVRDALERAHGEQFDQLLLTLLSAALLLCGGATLARALFLKQLEQKERDSVAPTARNKGAAVVLIGSGLGLLAKAGAGVPAAALAAFPLAAAALVVGALVRGRRRAAAAA